MMYDTVFTNKILPSNGDKPLSGQYLRSTDTNGTLSYGNAGSGLVSYTEANIPQPNTSIAGDMIYVSDLNIVAYSNGSHWYSMIDQVQLTDPVVPPSTVELLNDPISQASFSGAVVGTAQAPTTISQDYCILGTDAGNDNGYVRYNLNLIGKAHITIQCEIYISKYDVDYVSMWWGNTGSSGTNNIGYRTLKGFVNEGYLVYYNGTNLGATSTHFAHTAGTWAVHKTEFDNDTIKYYIDGNLVSTFVDTNRTLTGEYLFFQGYSNTNKGEIRIRNVLVEEIV